MSSAISASDSRSAKPKVIYVMGAGRSGSTILGVTLGNCADIFFAGELDKWLPRGGEPKRNDPERTQFWQRVRSQTADPDTVREGHPKRYLERSSALFRIRRGAVRRLRTAYRRVTSELYDAVASTAQTSHIIDTSHYPLRAREIQSLQSVEVYLLLLVRDPQDVVASFNRDDVVERRMGPVTTRFYLLLTYVLSTWVFLKHPRERRAVLFYEDLLDDPQGVLRNVLDRVGSDAELPDFTSLSTGIPFHGNRLIDAISVSLQPRVTRADRGTFVERLFASLLTGALARLAPRVSARPLGGESRPRGATLAR